MTLGDVCSYIAIAPATRTSYDRLHVRVSAISLVDVYIAKGKNWIYFVISKYNVY